MIVTLLTEHHLEFISLKGGCRGSSESTLVKMPHYWKSCHGSIICMCSMVLCNSLNSMIAVVSIKTPVTPGQRSHGDPTSKKKCRSPS